MAKMIEISAAEYERLQDCIREDGMRIAALIEENKAKIQVLRSTDKWFGVTYREDKPLVVEAIARKTAEGQYPEKLWE